MAQVVLEQPFDQTFSLAITNGEVKVYAMVRGHTVCTVVEVVGLTSSQNISSIVFEASGL